MTLRLAFLTTHPIQYQAPVFRALAREPGVEFTALFAMLPDARQQGDGFGVGFEWDLPLCEGYDYEVLTNVAREPAVGRFRGCDTPGVGRVIRRLQLDALVVNGWVVKSCLQGLAACRRQRVPCIVRGEANRLRERAWWKSLVHGRLLHRYAAAVYIGAANKAFYERHGIPESRLFPALYCVENRRFQEHAARSADRVTELRQRFGVPGDAVCFLFCAKFIDKKHPVELLASFSRLIAQGGRAHLLMVGDGELRPACEALVRERGLPVTFAGFLNQSEIADAYVAADCLVLPSDAGETWGLVVNEAMACGRPAIVSSLVGCAQDLIQPGRTGDVFRFGDWDALATLLARYAQDRNLLHTMGALAREQIERYSPEAAAQGILQAARSVTSGRTPRRAAQSVSAT